MKNTASEKISAKQVWFTSIALNPNPLIAPLAIVLIGGLISSTILSRIVTPVMYKLIPPHLESDDSESLNSTEISNSRSE